MSSTELPRRLRLLLIAFVALVLTVYGRLIALEVRDGAEYRAVAAEPIVRRQSPPAMRGRILSHDGTVLACDEPLTSLAVQYRWLEEPADPRWLRRLARSRLSVRERRDPGKVAAEQEKILDERRDLTRRLAALCGLSESQWRARADRIQRRVEKIAATVNSSQAASQAARQDKESLDGASLPSLVGRSIVEAIFALDDTLAAPKTVIAEELDDHPIYTGLPLEAVAEIQTHPERYPGVKLQTTYERTYPQGALAPHTLGYLGRPRPEELSAPAEPEHDDGYQADDFIGRAGIERQYESLLRARRGLVVERLDARGQTIDSTTVRQPSPGRDVVLSIDADLERSAQSFLDQALARRLPSGNERLDRASGGALLVIDVHTGAILAAAAAPRFDPNAFAGRNSADVQRWLADPARPMFDRTLQMALPPGSVFKVVSAAAILAAGVDPNAPVECEGYLHQPNALRCAIFRKTGVGHGAVTMYDALAKSCNVYFFHHAEQIGAAPLVDWALRFGLGGRGEIDLPSEAAGTLPRIAAPTDATTAQRKIGPDARPLAIGQSTITATPLQIARIMAAVANGGYLVTPHLAESNPAPAPRAIPGLTPGMLAAIRKGLRQTVADEEGTAHAAVDSPEVAIAGKTGTAQTGPGQPDHAWFAGYAPANDPAIAFVVVLEYAGDAAPATGPAARLLAERMQELGYFSKGRLAQTQ